MHFKLPKSTAMFKDQPSYTQSGFEPKMLEMGEARWVGDRPMVLEQEWSEETSMFFTFRTLLQVFLH